MNKKITALDISRAVIPASGQSRNYSILGDNGASFILQVVKGSQFYNFKTRVFVNAHSPETMLRSTISGSKFNGKIRFPSGGTAYNVILLANPNDLNTRLDIGVGKGAINKRISQTTDSTITLALSTANTSNYATLPTLTNTTGSSVKLTRSILKGISLLATRLLIAMVLG